MRSPRYSFIVTIYNEEKTIKQFLDSLLLQTKKPDEVIITDGGSIDRTVAIIESYKKKFNLRKIPLTLLIKKGNRSIGRNAAIKKAKGNIILCSDAGNTLDKNWIKEIEKPFSNSKVDVVAGYYKGQAKSIFQKSIIPYALVMEDKVDPKTFLPATRSVAFKKAIWQKVGGFDERYSHNEDYVFAKRLQNAGAHIVFAKNAIVNWYPRNTFKEAFVMFYRFAFGDAESMNIRSKVLFLLARYVIAFYILGLSLIYKNIYAVLFIILLFFLYILWAVQKNYKYVRDKKAFVILPALQFTADVAVIKGTLQGFWKIIIQYDYLHFIKQNKFFLLMLFIYIALILLTLKWGIPNQNHPFPYMMDEWHQLQAVRATAKFGTPNIAGAANGTMFHFILAVLYLIPFTLLDIINPVVLKINDLAMREQIFVLLRFNTLIWGVLSLFVLYNISKLINAPPKVTVALFVFTPMWLILSSFFKYDIGLMFWILLTIYMLLRFAKHPTNRNYIFAAIPAGLAFAVKVSAIPLLPIYIIAFFLFHPKWKEHFRSLFAGIAMFGLTVVLFGIPDTIFGKGNIILFFNENVVSGPKYVDNFALGMHPFQFLLTHQYPLIFGHGLLLLFIAAVLFCFIAALKVGSKRIIRDYKIEVFLIISFCIFLLSLIPLQFYAGGNRSLVLLPFMVLLCALFWKHLQQNGFIKSWGIIFLILIFALQLFHSFVWVQMKFVKSPQEVSSEWILRTIPKQTLIGLEPQVLYQHVPEYIEKEFYFQEYNVPYLSRYRYQIIDEKTKKLPAIIIVTNGDVEASVYKTSSKKSLVERLRKEQYRKLAEFRPDFTYFKYLGANDVDYAFSYITSTPVTITIYKK